MRLSVYVISNINLFALSVSARVSLTLNLFTALPFGLPSGLRHSGLLCL
jgi:hypothetical protein